MTKYKIVKIWFVEEADEESALEETKVRPVNFVSVNDKFKVGEKDILNFVQMFFKLIKKKE